MRNNRTPSFRVNRGYSAGAVTVASFIGLAVGIATSLWLVAARWSLLDHMAAANLVACATPAVSAGLAALMTGSILRWRRTFDRVTVVTAVSMVAVFVFLVAMLIRLLEPAAIAATGASDPLSASFWYAGYEWLIGAEPTDLLMASALAPLEQLGGAMVVWPFLTIELVVVSVFALWVADLGLNRALCTSCNEWCNHERGVLRCVEGMSDEQVTLHAQQRNWTFFASLAPPNGRRGLRFDLAGCRRCQSTAILSIVRTNGLWSETPIVVGVRLGPDDLRTVRSLQQQFAQRAHIKPTVARHSGRVIPLGTPVPAQAPPPRPPQSTFGLLSAMSTPMAPTRSRLANGSRSMAPVAPLSRPVGDKTSVATPRAMRSVSLPRPSTVDDQPTVQFRIHHTPSR